MFTLLPKKGDLDDLRNWHLILLLSTDCKITLKAVSLRLKSVWADMVHSNQTYAFLGQIVFSNLYLV